MGKRKSKVKDLVEKLQRREVTPKEAKRILTERGLMKEDTWKGRILYLMILVAYFILCIMPLPFKRQLQLISFPAVAVYVSFVLLGIGIFFSLWVDYSHRKKGGLKGSDETIIFYRDGPYGIMRHPGIFGFIVWFICLPIAISAYVPFTFLSIIGIILAVGFHYYMAYVEEKTNIMKWGDEYIQYIKEVPRFRTIIVVGAIIVAAAIGFWVNL
jgi:protein-S-isoprenylcysteine O-methyltransferase Ste14